MSRIPAIADSELTEEARELLEQAERAGSPDSRVLRVLFRSPIGIAWYRYWQVQSNQGELSRELKELCRVKIAFDHTCGYCSTVRSKPAKDAGLTEEKIQQVWDFESSDAFSPRERTALRFAHYIKHDVEKAGSDEIYAELREYFSDSEIVELGLWCAQNEGAGKFVRTLNILTWDEACELNPLTAQNAARKSG